VIAPKVPEQTAREMRDAYELVTMRDNNSCQRCRRDCGQPQRDHRQNRMQGNTVASNLIVLGAGCHAWKTNHPDEAIADGWAVARFTMLAPGDWPARRWLPTEHGTMKLGWVLFDNQGGFTVIDDLEAAYRRRKGGL
jgi:hypothetical protein